MKESRGFEPLPYYRWYWRDWRASRSVQRLSLEARGMYRELLDECWAKGFIPGDVRDLAEICHASQATIRKHWPAVQKLFVKGDDGNYVSERLENERTETDRKRIAASRAGKLSGESRRGGNEGETNDRSTTVQRPFLSRSTSSSSSSAKQSKSSSSAAPVALRPEGRAPGSGGEMTLAADVLAGFGQVRAALGIGPEKVS